MPINLCTAAACSGLGISRMVRTLSGWILSPSPEVICLMKGTSVCTVESCHYSTAHASFHNIANKFSRFWSWS